MSLYGPTDYSSSLCSIWSTYFFRTLTRWTVQCWWMLSSLYSSFKSLNVICKWFCLAVTVPKIQGVEIGPKFNLSKKSPFLTRQFPTSFLPKCRVIIHTNATIIPPRMWKVVQLENILTSPCTLTSDSLFCLADDKGTYMIVNYCPINNK
jgi:hypothetical protein